MRGTKEQWGKTDPLSVVGDKVKVDLPRQPLVVTLISSSARSLANCVICKEPCLLHVLFVQILSSKSGLETFETTTQCRRFDSVCRCTLCIFRYVVIVRCAVEKIKDFSGCKEQKPIFFLPLDQKKTWEGEKKLFFFL